MYSPLLTIYTPTYRRPKALAQNIASVRGQTVGGTEHLIIPDLIGLGVNGMFRSIKEHTSKITGLYVYVLQDDDVLASRACVENFQNYLVGQKSPPPVIMCKNIKGGRMLPDLWQVKPRLRHVDLGSFIVRADVFKANADKFTDKYEADFDFIEALYDQGLPFHWWNFVFARALQIGKGRPENDA